MNYNNNYRNSSIRQYSYFKIKQFETIVWYIVRPKTQFKKHNSAYFQNTLEFKFRNINEGREYSFELSDRGRKCFLRFLSLYLENEHMENRWIQSENKFVKLERKWVFT